MTSRAAQAYRETQRATARVAAEYKSVQEAVDALRAIIEGVSDTQALSDPTIDELQVGTGRCCINALLGGGGMRAL